MALANVPTEPKRKTISPYDLSSNDNPGAIISQPLLTGTNYDEWAINFRMALSSRKKFGFLDGSIPKPAANSPDLEDWIANNHLLVGWIKQTIDPKIRSSISTREIAKELWDIIKKRFSIKSGTRLQQLRNSLATCKQNGSSVDDYFGRLTKIWDAISECMNSKRCNCGKCECDLNTAHDKERETLRIHDFLSGLDDATHGVIRSQICAISPLPDLDSVYQTVVQNETIRSSVSQETTVMSFASRIPSSNFMSRPDSIRTQDVSRQSIGGTSRPPNRDPSRKCTGCGKMGHEVSGCFKIVGYPDWWEERKNSRSDNRNSSFGRGHGSSPQVNSTQVIGANSVCLPDISPISDKDRQGLSGITDDQWSIIKRVVNEKSKSDQLSGKNNSISWILDTGATHHMTGRSDILEEVRNIIPVWVKLPNGRDSLASKQGSIRLSQRLTLHNVYLVDGFDTNDTSNADLDIPHDSLGKGKRQKFPSVKLRDYVVQTSSLSTPPLPATNTSSDQSSSGTPYPISNYVSCDRFSSTHRGYLVTLTTNIEPTSFMEAMKHFVWKKAMGSEVTALELNKTWDLVDLPPNKKALGCKWVYRIKLNSDGTIERYKARLVVLGNHQKEGLDYKETFAPVAKMSTVRLFLDIAAKQNYEVHQMDVHNPFLHGDLHEEVYMKLPPGFSTPGDTRVCKLKKSLYGLKQAPRCWFAKLADALEKYGFKQTRSDYSLFIYMKNGINLRILVYVDDLIISGNSPTAIQSFKDYLSTCFHMKDLGFLKYFLGIEVARSPLGFYLCQRKYATEIVTEAGLLGCKPAGSPIDQKHSLARANGPFLEDPETYRRLIGRLVYLGNTRPDLTYSIHILSQFMREPRADHWLAALKVVRYLKGTLGQGILLKADSPMHFTGWCDSDHAACPLTRRSLSGRIVQFGDSLISWKTQKQDVVSNSSAEAEYRSMSELARELKWLKALLSDFGIVHDKPMTVFCDNQAALHISSNPVFHERTKHIEKDCHLVRDEIVKGNIDASHVSTTIQLADILTKALGKAEFDAFLLKLGVQNLHAPT